MHVNNVYLLYKYICIAQEKNIYFINNSHSGGWYMTLIGNKRSDFSRLLS